METFDLDHRDYSIWYRIVYRIGYIEELAYNNMYSNVKIRDLCIESVEKKQMTGNTYL